jgi:ParB family chromosome partitioning protein
LTAGHARTLVATESPAALAEQIITLGLSVREAESLTREAAPVRLRKPKSEKHADTKALERAVAEALGLRIEIHDRGEAGGTVAINYKTLEQLEEICKRLQSRGTTR